MRNQMRSREIPDVSRAGLPLCPEASMLGPAMVRFLVATRSITGVDSYESWKLPPPEREERQKGEEP